MFGISNDLCIINIYTHIYLFYIYNLHVMMDRKLQIASQAHCNIATTMNNCCC